MAKKSINEQITDIMSDKELNERLCRYIEQEAQIFNAICPMVAMIKSVTDNNAIYNKNTVISKRTGATLDDYLKRLYNVFQDLENMHSEIAKVSVYR